MKTRKIVTRDPVTGEKVLLRPQKLARNLATGEIVNLAPYPHISPPPGFAWATTEEALLTNEFAPRVDVPVEPKQRKPRTPGTKRFALK